MSKHPFPIMIHGWYMQKGPYSNLLVFHDEMNRHLAERDSVRCIFPRIPLTVLFLICRDTNDFPENPALQARMSPIPSDFFTYPR
jgi:hypothetical protein